MGVRDTVRHPAFRRLTISTDIVGHLPAASQRVCGLRHTGEVGRIKDAAAAVIGERIRILANWTTYGRQRVRRVVVGSDRVRRLGILNPVFVPDGTDGGCYGRPPLTRVGDLGCGVGYYPVK